MKSVPSLLFFKPMKEEPTVSEKWVIATKPPYLVGEKCYVREAWGVGSRPHPYEGCIDGIEYKTDEQYLDEHDDLPLYQVKTPDGVDLCDYASGWHSPVTMPAWAARRFVTILSCEPMRVEEVTEEDAIKMGVEQLREPGTWKDYGDPDSICLGATGSFLSLWHQRHPDKKWCWRVEGKED